MTAPMNVNAASGIVAFLFTDIESSTQMRELSGVPRMTQPHAEYDQALTKLRLGLHIPALTGAFHVGDQ